MNWKTVRLELAASPAFPSGSVSRGYLIRLPLNDDGSVDQASLGRSPAKATVRRFWSTEPDESGRIEFVEGSWALRCNGNRVLSIRPSTFRIGESVSVIGADGSSLPFRVASIGRFARMGEAL